MLIVFNVVHILLFFITNIYFHLQPQSQTCSVTKSEAQAVQQSVKCIRDHTKDNSGQPKARGKHHEKQPSEERTCSRAGYLSPNFGNILFTSVTINPCWTRMNFFSEREYVCVKNKWSLLFNSTPMLIRCQHEDKGDWIYLTSLRYTGHTLQ